MRNSTRATTPAAIVALLLCVPSRGQDTSTITYRLGLGGDNGVELYEGSADYYPLFEDNLFAARARNDGDSRWFVRPTAGIIR